VVLAGWFFLMNDQIRKAAELCKQVPFIMTGAERGRIGRRLERLDRDLQEDKWFRAERLRHLPRRSAEKREQSRAHAGQVRGQRETQKIHGHGGHREQHHRGLQGLLPRLRNEGPGSSPNLINS